MNDTKKILIIDDEPSICTGCKLILSENGYHVDTALTGQNGLDKLFEESFDIALLDIRLPDMNGLDILGKINASKMDITVIIMTGHGTVKNAVKAMKNRAFDFLTKPFNENELSSVIRKALENRALIQENLALKKKTP